MRMCSRENLSLLPFTGPLVGLFNLFDLAEREERESASFDRAVLIHTCCERTLSSIKEGTTQLKLARSNMEVKSREYSRICETLNQKGGDYSLYGIAGSILSLAALTGLVALNIITEEVWICASLAYGALTLIFGSSYYTYKSQSNGLEEPEFDTGPGDSSKFDSVKTMD